MTPDSTLAVTKTCPKDGVHLSGVQDIMVATIGNSVVPAPWVDRWRQADGASIAACVPAMYPPTEHRANPWSVSPAADSPAQ